MLIKEALSILQKANTKISELGVELVDLDASNSPGAPAVREQLSECVIRYDLLLKFITLNDAGTAILGTTGDNDADLNSLLIQMQEIGNLNEFVLPSPIVRIVETDGDGEGLPDGASEGDLVYFHNGEWVLLPKGTSGQSLVSTTTTVQWQNQVGNGIPSGGTTGQVLRKASDSDYIVEWHSPVLADITDVTPSAADVNILLGSDAAGVTPTNIAHLSGTSGNIQTQINSKLTSSLGNGFFFVGDGAGAAQAVQPTGDVTFNNSGLFSIASGVIVNGDISFSANITRTKLANGNSWRLVINNASGVISEASVITGSRVLVSDSNGIPTASTVSTTTIAFMDATSSVQTQINNKLSFDSSIVPTQGDIIWYTGAAWENLAIGSNGQLLKSDGSGPVWVSDPPTGLPAGGTTNQYLRKATDNDYEAEWHTLLLEDVTDVSVPVAELNLLTGLTVSSSLLNLADGLSGNIQTQLNAKLSNSLAQNYLFIGNASNQVTQLSPGSNGQVLTTVGTAVVWTSPATPGDVSGPGLGNSTDNAIVRWSGTTGASIQNSGIIVDDSDNTTYPTGASIRTSTTDTNTLLLQAYNSYTLAYVTFGTLMAGNPPTFDLNSTTTIGGDTIYRSLSGKALSQPTASEDTKSIRWNDGSNEWEYFTPGGGGGHTIQGNGTPFTARTNLNFLADFVVDDDSGNDATTVTIAAFTGDVTKVQGGTALTIANDAVTFAKFQNITTSRILGRTTASSGDVEELTVSSPLTLAAGALGIQVATGAQNGYLSSADWTTFNDKWTKPSFTTGSVLFWGASDVAQDNTGLFFNDADDILYLGANSGAFSNTRFQSVGSVNAYLQNNIINTSNGTSASGDWIVTADTGTDTTNFVDVGINSSGFTDASFTVVGALGSYLYSNGGDLAVGVSSANKNIYFFTGGTLSSNRKMSIDTNGVFTLTSSINGSAWASTWTATGNNQTARTNTGTITARATTTDNIFSDAYATTLVTGANDQRLHGMYLNYTFTDGHLTTQKYPLRVVLTAASGATVLLGPILSSTNESLVVQANTATADQSIASFKTSTDTASIRIYNSTRMEFVGATTANIGMTSASSSYALTGTTLTYSSTGSTTHRVAHLFRGGTYTSTTNNVDNYFVAQRGNFAASSGSSRYTSLSVEPTIAQTGTASGSITGISVIPDVASTILGTYYSIVTSSGLAGFGTINPTATLQAKGRGTTTSELFRLDDSASTNRLLILDNGTLTHTAAINGSSFGGTWTATANNQYHLAFGGTFTTRSNDADVLDAYIFNPTVAVSSSNTQSASIVRISGSFTGGNSSDITRGLLVDSSLLSSAEKSTITALSTTTTAQIDIIARSVTGVANLTLRAGSTAETGVNSQRATFQRANGTNGILNILNAGSGGVTWTFAGNDVITFDSTGRCFFGGSTAPTSFIETSSSVGFGLTSVSIDTTLTNAHYTVLVDASGANRTITLPEASGCTRRIYVVKKTDNSANTVTIDGNSSETIDGATTKVINTQYAGYMIQSNGTSWFIIATF